MKPSFKTIVSICSFLILSCSFKSKNIGNIMWPFDIRQNLPVRQPPTCDTFLYKTLHFEINHEQDIDTSQFGFVISSSWPLYSGNYTEKLVIDSIPFCLSDKSPQPLKCYLVDKKNRISYQFQSKHYFDLFDSKVQNIKVKLYSSYIEDSSSNMKVSINDGNWFY
ncbi:hypothetical protein [Flavisolibacter tropicus]|uniref:Lipoprotein n=1 Tax=Flavisolibacter tropicus TaxID=1492898 RepID=A0A172TYD8_9BACT|nr:hypothetical protein [Flavisolibacter tropicus]ANE52109.1 hypothetical protein SY85_18010 [Flavisolibacter tropicus]